MIKHQYSVNIQATPERVWDVLFTRDTYGQWTKPFSEKSDVETDWQEGSKVYFTAGEGNGMVSIIDKRIDNQVMNFRHIGELRDGKEDLESAKDGDWAGAMENYSLSQAGDGTTLTVDIDVTEEWVDWMNEKWPEAMKLIKELSEQG